MPPDPLSPNDRPVPPPPSPLSFNSLLPNKKCKIHHYNNILSLNLRYYTWVLDWKTQRGNWQVIKIVKIVCPRKIEWSVVEWIFNARRSHVETCMGNVTTVSYYINKLVHRPYIHVCRFIHGILLKPSVAYMVRAVGSSYRRAPAEKKRFTL